ncbi:MAG: cardiolipin synthase [Phycisphaerales bacterium]
MFDWQLWVWVTLLADFGLRLVFAVRIVMRRAPVPTVLSWLVVILLLPGLGIPLYVLIGEVRLGSRRVRRYLDAAKGIEEQAHVFWKSRAQNWTSDVEPYHHIARLLTGIAQMPPLVGNRITLIADTREFVRAVVKDVDGAARWCHVLTFIWAPDEFGMLLGEALIRAASRGVECRVLVDAAGSRKFLRSDLAVRMRGSGVTIVAALPVTPLRAVLARVDIRNHRKIAVIDGWVAFTGSHNVTHPSYGHKPRTGIGPWIDASVRIEGPAAQALEVVFLHDWHMESDAALPEVKDLLPEPSLPESGSIVQVVPSGPVPSPDAIQEAMLTTIYAARREIIMTTPYFVPDEAMKTALVCAARQGVNVTLVVPRKLDGRLVAAASRSHYTELLEGGVRILEHAPGLLHAKTVTIDADVALIGSTNLDIRSFRLNFEITLFVFDSDFASHMRMLQTEYIAQSKEVFADEWKARPLWPRLKENVARLASPLL